MKNISSSSVYWVSGSDASFSKNKFHYVFLPDSKFKAYWNMIMIVLMLYSVIMSPIDIAFIESQIYSLYILDFVLDGFFFVDMILTCLTAYSDSESNLILSHRKILCNYLTGWFLLDALSCFPIQAILDSQQKYNSLVRVTRLQRLYRILRLTKVLRFMKAFRSNKQHRFLNLALKVSVEVEKLIWFLWLIFLLIHLITCFWVFMGGFYSTETSQNWIQQYSFQNYSDLDMYIIALYWTVTTLVTVGYGDICATNTSERIYVTVIMIIGIFMYSYTVSSISTIISTLDTRKAKLNSKLDLLSHIARKHKLSVHFEQKVSMAIEYEHRNNDKELEEVVADLPVTLKQQLLNIIYGQKIKQNSFLAQRSSQFATWVVSKLKPVKIGKKEFIYKENEFATEMYFIYKGTASLMAKSGGDFFPYIIIEENYFFGEVDLLFSSNKTHFHTAYSEEGCELLSLSRENFEELLGCFEDETIEICLQAKQRLDRTNNKLREALSEYDARYTVKATPTRPTKSKINIQKIRDDTRRSVERVSEIRSTSMYQTLIELKKPENNIATLRKKIKSLNICAETINGLSNDLYEMIVQRQRFRSSSNLMS